MCGVTLKDRVRSGEFMDVLEIECVEEMVSRVIQKLYGHIERKDKSEWVSASRVYRLREQRVRGEVERRETSV